MAVQYCEGCFDENPSYVRIDGLRLCKDCLHIIVYDLLKTISEMTENEFVIRFSRFLETAYKNHEQITKAHETKIRGFYKSAKEFFAKSTLSTMKNFTKYLFLITQDGFNIVNPTSQGDDSYNERLKKLNKLLQILRRQHTLRVRDISVLSILTQYKSSLNTPTSSTGKSWVWDKKRKHYTPSKDQTFSKSDQVHQQHSNSYTKKTKR
jgi:hypothetical protein